MKNYWSCSKFADWIRGTAKPHAGTGEEWTNWENHAKTKRIRYWLAEDGLDFLQDFLFWPIKRFNDFRFYFNNRWITQSHVLTSKLKRGEWYDYDTRLLHTVFDELVNFVEIELAWMNVVFSEENQIKYKTPWYRRFFKIRAWRNPESGLEYLDWASQLKYDQSWMDKTDPLYGQPTPQALAAQEILKIYKWWKEERPKRPDPYDASGWSKYCDDIHNLKCNILNTLHQMEQDQDDEDTEMLIRLIKIRHHLWT